MRLAALILAFLLVPAAGASAGWQPPLAIDGPNPAVVGLGGVDLARDGTGAVAYLRRDGAFVSRVFQGAWRAPERIDAAAASEVKVAAGDRNRLALVWIAGGTVWATVAAGGDQPGGFAAPVAIGGPGASSVDVDLGVNGAAYAVWQQGGDVRAARLQDATWTPLGSPLDVLPAMEAGTGALRPKVAVSAEGFALATWGEAGTDGRTHVYARRLLGLNLSAFPQDLTAGAGNADSPDVDTRDDSGFAWVVFRQDGAQSLAREMLGRQFEPPVPIDAGGAPSGEPRVDINADGDGAAVAQVFGTAAFGSLVHRNAFQPATRLDGGSAGPVSPDVSATDRGDIAAAWRALTGDGVGHAHARFRESGEDWGPDTPLSRDDLGSVADPGVAIGGDRVGDFAVAFAQGPESSRTLSLAVFDRPPGTPALATSRLYKRRPELRWRPGLDLWGAQTFRVLVDGVSVGETQATTFVPTQKVRSGRHTLQIEAVDRAGQAVRSRPQRLLIDSSAPRLRVTVRGRRRAGVPLRITVRAKDRGATGLDHVTVDYGDRSRRTRAPVSRHSYRRGRFTLKVTAVDKAGNVARKQVRLRIR